MQFSEYRDFAPSLIRLKRRFGQYQAAATSVESLQGRIAQYEKGQTTENPLNGLTATRHGESRIRNCVKYHLSGHARLVTLQTDHFCVLLYTGTHDEVDTWLDRHVGFELLVDAKNQATSTFRRVRDEDVLGCETGTYHLELYRRLSDAEFEVMAEGLPRKIVRALEDLRTGFKISELKQTLGQVEDRERAALLVDVFTLLAGDRVDQARTRILQFQNVLQPLDEIDVTRLPNVVNAEILRTHSSDDPTFRHLLKRFADTASYRDWMLFMHPDQEKVVNEDFDGPAKLVGVSGSGKTCIVVRRAIRLAAKYQTERVLVVTLNRALAALIEDLVDCCAPEEVRGRIDVLPFFVLCQQMIGELDPANAHKYDEYSHKLGENVEDVWQEFYRCELNNRDALVFRPVHDSLLARGCSPEKYLREEVNWLRSAYPNSQRTKYLTGQRIGRKYNIAQHLRQAILDGTAAWERKMKDVAVYDTLGLAQELSGELAYLPQRYRCILVDEVQDFGNTELEIIHAIMQPGENNLFLTGDAAQAVTTKYRQFAGVGIQIPRSRSRALSRNYRNSEDILKAAYAVLRENLSEEMIENEDLDIKDPEASSFTGRVPTILRADSLEEELGHAFAMSRERIAQQPAARVCISVCGYTLEEMRQYGRTLGLPVLDGQSKLDAHPIFLSDLAHTKGFEFDMVCILNCRDGVLPDHHLPAEEHSRHVAMLYVAMTRAKMDLCISYSGTLSRIFDQCTDSFLHAPWSEYASREEAGELLRPAKTEEWRVDSVQRPWREMTGDEFLFSEHAIGIQLELIESIRRLVNGPPQRKAGTDIKWRRMGDAVDSVRQSVRSAAIWGTERSRQLLALADRLEALS